jgi:DNA-directed RNA polymerase subunit RPC12/RpoP
VETVEGVVGCPGCGSRALVKGRRRTKVRDLPCGGRPVVVVWAKRIWRCGDADCDVGSWSETSPALLLNLVEDGRHALLRAPPPRPGGSALSIWDRRGSPVGAVSSIPRSRCDALNTRREPSVASNRWFVAGGAGSSCLSGLAGARNAATISPRHPSSTYPLRRGSDHVVACLPWRRSPRSHLRSRS